MEELDLTSLIDQAKKATQTPIQRVRPVKKVKPAEKEIQIAFYLPKSLYKKVKQRALQEEVSIKSILTLSIEKYINDIS